jgi:lipopolysaccharide/colanic/teichoic acid biosynthesis glycosyltransferase
VFYLQERVGEGGKAFKVMKFATMLKSSPSLEGGFLTQQDDPRVLPVGQFLRKSKINELPQLLNVFLGSMSMVGPRPQARVHHMLYTSEQRALIEQMRPGITGVGSLVFHDEESLLYKSGQDFDTFHDTIIAPFKGDLECWFHANVSLRLYIKVVLMTAISVAMPGFKVLRHFHDMPLPPSELQPFLWASKSKA